MVNTFLSLDITAAQVALSLEYSYITDDHGNTPEAPTVLQ